MKTNKIVMLMDLMSDPLRLGEWKVEDVGEGRSLYFQKSCWENKNKIILFFPKFSFE